MAPVRLTVSPSLMPRSSHKDDDANVVGSRLSASAHAAGKLHHLAGLHLVEPVDTGDAVADRQHLADFRDLGLFTEVLDLLFQDR